VGMTAIKFRQRNKHNGQFHYWGMIDGAWVMPPLTDNYVRPEESDQYTGLKDKNGVEIYEGDIVKNDWRSVHGKFIGDVWVVMFGEHETSLDYYATSAYGFFYRNSKGEDHTPYLPTERGDGVEVIGNIHQNPELLEINDE